MVIGVILYSFYFGIILFIISDGKGATDSTVTDVKDDSCVRLRIVM